MKRTLTLLLLLTLHLWARYDAYPSKICPAYNNMKHTHNSHHVMLDPERKYTVLDVHKGQKLIVVKGEQPAQRWVDGECFEAERPGASQKTERAVPSGETDRDNRAVKRAVSRPEEMLLALSWHNAFCETHRSRKECRRGGGGYGSDSHFVLHGLWPQPISNVYCNVSPQLKKYDRNRLWSRLPEPPMSTETKQELARVMPGVASYLHRHEWIKHGTCSGRDAESYFKEAAELTTQVNRSRLGHFFTANQGKRVTLRQIRFKVDESFGKGSGRRVEMLCRRGMITELWFHLRGEGKELSELLKNGKKARSRCRKGRIDSIGYR